jgi:hypothetical protein
MGKEIRTDGPESHLGKAGTPTMGGIMVILPVIVATLLLNNQGRSILVPVGTLLFHGVIGAIDDIRSLAGSAQTGLTAPVQFGLLLGLATTIAVTLHYGLRLESIYLPFLGKIPIGAWYVPIAAFTILATANAVNLTDGLDTLAADTHRTATKQNTRWYTTTGASQSQSRHKDFHQDQVGLDIAEFRPLNINNLLYAVLGEETDELTPQNIARHTRQTVGEL